MTTDNPQLTDTPQPAAKPVRADLIFNPPDLGRTLARMIGQSPTDSQSHTDRIAGPTGQDDDDE